MNKKKERGGKNVGKKNRSVKKEREKKKSGLHD